MRIAYLVNQYPSPTHTFIRREIHALEQLGIEVRRYSVRRWTGELPDAADQRERDVTRVVLDVGVVGLAWAALCALVGSPRAFFRTLALAWRVGRRSDRGLLFHAIYVAESCVLRRWFRADGVSHVHAHFGTNSTTVAMFCHALGGPTYSFTVHGPEEFDKPEALGLPDKIVHARFVVAISSFGRSQLYRWVGVEHWPKIQVVHCALDDSFFESKPEPPTSRDHLVCVGRLAEQKGQLLLIAAVAEVRATGRNIRLTLVGDGPMRGDIANAISRHGLEADVRLAGWLDNARVRDVVRGARAVVLPSFAEGLPVVLMEAMALGRPVLTTRIAGIPELVVDGRSGWLIAAGSIPELTDGLCRVLDADVDELSRITADAFTRVRSRHHSLTEARRLAALIRDGEDTPSTGVAQTLAPPPLSPQPPRDSADTRWLSTHPR